MRLELLENISNDDFNNQYPLKNGMVRFFSYKNLYWGKPSYDGNIQIHDVELINSYITAEDLVQQMNSKDDRWGTHSFAFVNISDCVKSLMAFKKRTNE